MVNITITVKAEYSLLLRTPDKSPIEAKIRPTSPLGIIPIPITNLSAFKEKAPNPLTNLPTTAITNKTKEKIITAMFSLIKGLNTEMSTADPTIIKNIGINTSATGFSLSSISVF